MRALLPLQRYQLTSAFPSSMMVVRYALLYPLHNVGEAMVRRQIMDEHGAALCLALYEAEDVD